MNYDKMAAKDILLWLAGFGLLFASFSCWAGNSGVLSLGYEHSCGIKTDNTVACWGNNNYGQATPPAGTFTQNSSGYRHTCGLKTNGTISCWGANNEGQSSQPVGGFIWISAGWDHTCALKPSGIAICWGDNDYGQTSSPLTAFAQITAGRYHTCGLKSDGYVECWGSNSYERTTPPDDTFTQISAGQDHTCGLTTSGTGVCWGYPSKSLGFLIQADAYCGLKIDKTGMCHSGNLTSSAFPVSGIFTYIAGGYSHGCGLRNNGAVECWPTNNNYYGQTTPPNGVTFKQPSPPPAVPQALKLTNISTRGAIQGGAYNVIAGFTITGTGTQKVLIRAQGLEAGVDPSVTLYNFPSGTTVATNNNWQTDSSASKIPTLMKPAKVTDATLLRDLAAGAYTAIMSSTGKKGLGIISVDAID